MKATKNMADGFTVFSSIFGAVGTIGAITGTVAALKTSSARRYVERGTGAAALLDALDKTGNRFHTPESDTDLRRELSRVIRESASVYARQYPTPAGDGLRMFVVIYLAFFVVVTPVIFLSASADPSHSSQSAMRLLGALCALVALGLVIVLVVLLDRLSRRNAARELSGTAGRERFFESVHEIRQTWRKYRLVRTQQRLADED
jgi:hypothetical protein